MLWHRGFRKQGLRVLILTLLGGVALAAAPGSPQVLPLPWLDGPCTDPRYPQLAGEWAVGCGPSGRVDRALHLETRRTVQLEQAATSPAVAPGVVYAPTREHGLWRLPTPEVDPSAPLVPLEGIAPPATDGEVVVLSLEAGVQVFRLDEKVRRTHQARPAPWYPPAVEGDLVAWVDVREGNEDVWALVEGSPVPVATTSLQERHVAVSGDEVAWIDQEGVHGWNRVTGETWWVETDAHTSRRLSLSEGVACWEAWNGLDVDVACSDGSSWTGPGHQRGPDRQGDQLLVVDRGRALLLVLPEQGLTAP